MAKPILTIALLIVYILLVISTAVAEVPLELIQVFDGDSADVLMSWGCTSPGDLDGDGFSEIYVAEQTGEKRLLIFYGGNSPDNSYDKVISGPVGGHRWIPDINADEVKDLVLRKPKVGGIETVEIWFGGTDFINKNEPDIIFHQSDDTVSAFGNTIYSGDINGDFQNDLIISSMNLELPPFEGRFSIYYGGDLLDTIPDDIINFYMREDGYVGFYRGSALGDINGDELIDMGYTISKSIDTTSYFAIIFGNIPLDTLPSIIFSSPFKWYHSPGGFGKEIIPLGDMNKDGFDDFAVGGSPVWPCIFYGGDPFDTIPIILGDTADELTRGDRIANIGDINHDGWDDIGVGYTSYSFGDGIVYIYFGSHDMDTEVDLIIYEDELWPIASGHFGESVGPAGDFNGDGIDDIAVSATQWLLSSQGRVFVFAGDSALPTPAEDEPDNPIPEKYHILKQNYPNPFNNRTVIEYTLWGISDREIELSVYNILGQRIRTLRKGVETGGKHIAYWDGKDDFGNDVCSGLYFYRLKANTDVLSKKMIYLK